MNHETEIEFGKGTTKKKKNHDKGKGTTKLGCKHCILQMWRGVGWFSWKNIPIRTINLCYKPFVLQVWRGGDDFLGKIHSLER